jgi:hypothetical protein
VKRNAIAGRSFASWEALEAHLAAWEREIANARVHGTTGEAPMLRFERDEAAALQPLADRPPFRACRTLERRVRNDCAVEVDGNAYSVPPPRPAGRVPFGNRIGRPAGGRWRLIGERVEVLVAAGRVRVRHGTREVAVHALALGRRQRVLDPAHLAGVTGAPGRPVRAPITPPEHPAPPPPQLLRPLAEYEALVGGGF